MRDLQASEDKDAADGYFLGNVPVESPDVWHGEDQQCPVSDDVRDGVADEELVDVHAAVGVYGFIPEATDG